MKPGYCFIFMLLSLPLRGFADVTDLQSGGFTVSHAVAVSATPQRSWDTMIGRIDQWWEPEHTWSADAANLYVQPGAGGCFCERLPGPAGEGVVVHLRIVYFQPNQEVRFEGALGPLQTMNVQGRMIWKVVADDSGSLISFTYMVHGSLDSGFDAIAPAVDGVIRQQLERLASLLNRS